MAERMQASLRIHRRTIRGSEYDARRANRRVNGAGSHHAHSDRARGLIACPGNYRGAYFQSCVDCARFIYLAADKAISYAEALPRPCKSFQADAAF